MGVRLPAEYQEVEYLKSTGTQYIDLGLNSPMVNGCFSVKTMIDYDTPGNTQFLGCNTDNSNKLPKVSIENTNFNLRQSGNKGTGSSLRGSIVVMTSDRNGNVYVNNVKRCTINTVSRTGNGYYLFNALPSYMQYAAKARIYSFNVWDDEKQFIDLIPCYRKFDSKPGMYDLVSGTFFTNAGTGEFVVGPDVIDSISPWLVARRRMLMRDWNPNLFDMADLEQGSMTASGENIASNTQLRSKNYINVEAGQQYTLSAAPIIGLILVKYFDANEVKISETTWKSNPLAFTTPIGTDSIRFLLAKSSITAITPADVDWVKLVRS